MAISGGVYAQPVARLRGRVTTSTPGKLLAVAATGGAALTRRSRYGAVTPRDGLWTMPV